MERESRLELLKKLQKMEESDLRTCMKISLQSARGPHQVHAMNLAISKPALSEKKGLKTTSKQMQNIDVQAIPHLL